MSDDDPVIVCCILGGCCPAGSARQRAALVKYVHHQQPGLTKEQAEGAADRILTEHDCFRGIDRVIKAAGV